MPPVQGKPPRLSTATTCCADEYPGVMRALGRGLGVLLGLAWVAVALGVLPLAVGGGCVFAPMTPKITSRATTPPRAVSTLCLRMNSMSASAQREGTQIRCAFCAGRRCQVLRATGTGRVTARGELWRVTVRGDLSRLLGICRS